MNVLREIYMWARKHLLKIDDRSQLEIAIENGLVIGENVAIMGETIIDPGHCWLIEIQDNVTIAPRVHILAHDASTKRELGYTRIGRVTIGHDSFIGANSIILPNVTIGDHVIIGAGSVVSKDIPSNTVAVGNPCKPIRQYDEYMKEKKTELMEAPRFNDSYAVNCITPEKKEEMNKRLKNQIGYVI